MLFLQAEDLPVSLTRRSEAPLRRSPDSSTSDMPVGSFRCPQCPFSCQDESGFSDHLLCVHRIRLVKTEPVAATTTRCPVCRQLVTDLSHHFAMEHAEKKTVNNNNSGSSNGIFGAAAGGKLTIMNGSVTSSSSNGSFAQLSDAAKVIPIFLPNHPLPESQLGRKSSNSNGSVDDSVTPMNLSLRRSSDAAADNAVGAFDLRSSNNNNDDVVNVIPSSFSTRSKDDSEDFEESASNFSGEFPSGPGSSESRFDGVRTHEYLSWSRNFYAPLSSRPTRLSSVFRPSYLISLSRSLPSLMNNL